MLCFQFCPIQGFKLRETLVLPVIFRYSHTAILEGNEYSQRDEDARQEKRIIVAGREGGG